MLSHLSASQVERGKMKHRLVTGLESAKACEQGHPGDRPQEVI